MYKMPGVYLQNSYWSDPPSVMSKPYKNTNIINCAEKNIERDLLPAV